MPYRILVSNNKYITGEFTHTNYMCLSKNKHKALVLKSIHNVEKFLDSYKNQIKTKLIKVEEFKYENESKTSKTINQTYYCLKLNNKYVSNFSNNKLYLTSDFMKAIKYKRPKNVKVVLSELKLDYPNINAEKIKIIKTNYPIFQ